MIRELDRVVLTTDLPDYGLKSGDIGTVVLVHRDNRGYEVEFVILMVRLSRLKPFSLTRSPSHKGRAG